MAAPPPPALEPEIGPDGITRENPIIAYTEKVILEEQLQLKKEDHASFWNHLLSVPVTHNELEESRIEFCECALWYGLIYQRNKILLVGHGKYFSCAYFARSLAQNVYGGIQQINFMNVGDAK